MAEAPRLCPSCARPSPAQYKVCMYCSTLLPSLARDEDSALPEDPGLDDEAPAAVRHPGLPGGFKTISSGALARIRGEMLETLSRSRGPFGPRLASYRLVLMPSAANREGAHWLKHRLVDHVGIDLYTARTHLNRLVPSYLAGSDELQPLQAMAAPLRDAGLQTAIIDRRRWLQDALPIPVIAVSREPGSEVCTFMVADGTSIDVATGSFSWASMAQISATVGARPEPVDDSDGPGRLPLSSLARDGGAFLLLDVVHRSGGGALRLRSDHFDFNCLGERRTVSAEVNLRMMLQWLAADPARPIPLDEYFRRVPAVAVDRPRDPSEGIGRGPLLARELEFTEYVLILDHFNRGAAV